MSENGETQNDTPSESEKMDISEISDLVSPVSDPSPSEVVDNAAPVSTLTYTTCERHPLDNATASTTSSATTRGRLESSLSLEGLDLELPTLDAYQEEYADFPSSPKQLKEAHGHAMPLEGDSGNTGNNSEEDDTSIYHAVLAPNCQDVRLRKDIDDTEDPAKQKLRRILTPNPEDLILPYSEQKIVYESNEPLEKMGYKKLDVIPPPEPSGFVFERRNSRRLSKKDKASNGRIMEGLFVESRNKTQTSAQNTILRKIPVPESLQNFDSPTKDENTNNHDTSTSVLETGVNTEQIDNLNINTINSLECNKEIIVTAADIHIESRNNVLNGNSKRTTGNRLAQRFTRRSISDNSDEILDADILEEIKLDRPGSLVSNQRGGRRKIRVTPALLAGSEGDVSSDDETRLSETEANSPVEEPDLDALLSAELDSPDELEDSILERLGEAPEPIPELSAAEERAEARSWRHCTVAGQDRRIDMKVIEPYKRVLSHGGYLSKGSHNAIIVFSACFLPDRSRVDYTYVMDNLFFYVLVTLEQLVTDDYVLVYLHGATSRACMPTFSWLKRCYQMIDRRLRKNLKGLYLVHPTFWLKTIVIMTRPFVSTKFSRKLSFVETLSELESYIPLEQASIPDRVKQLDFELTIRDMKHKKKVNITASGQESLS